MHQTQLPKPHPLTAFTDYHKRNLLLRYPEVMATHHSTLSKEVSMDMYDDSRLREFRQLKQQIRGSREHMVVGMDIAKDRHNAFFGIPTGKTLLRRFVFDNRRGGFESLCAHADLLKARHALRKVVFGMEPTADYHKPLAEYLIGRGHMVVLVGGVAVKRNRELLDGRWDKNDTKDAANVADLIAQGKCLFYDLPSPDLRELRGLLSLKRRLTKEEHGYRVRIRNHLLAQHFPEMDDSFGYAEGPALVKQCLNPQYVASLSFEEFFSLVSSRYGGQRQHLRLEDLYCKAHSSIGCAVTPGVIFEAAILLDGMNRVRAMIRDADVKIAGVCMRFPEYPSLLSIPGFGPDISSRVLGAIGNPLRFENERQVLKMAGLDLLRSQSGTREGIPVISKRGKADLRYGLYQAARIASMRNPRFMAYLTARLKGREREKGILTNRRVKLAAKMLVIAWTLMKKREVFDPGRITE
jgi:transposase